MNNYQDQWSRYHDKPTDGVNHSSNNGWIYTAYAQKAGLQVDDYKINDCYDKCLFLKTKTTFGLNRSPRKTTPPISRDEILGMAALNQLPYFHVYNWNFSPYPLPKFSLIKLVKQLWELRPGLYKTYRDIIPSIPKYSLSFKHRNYFWQNNLNQLYRLAFSVPLSDRHFILKKWGKFSYLNPVHLFYAALGKIQSKIKPNGLDWLKYDENKGLEGIKKEFTEDHPIRVKLGI